MPIDPESLIRPTVRHLEAYVPGEQPKVQGLVKLNTNENPYGPSPKVLARLQSAVDDRLRLYPNPSAERLRTRLAEFHKCTPEHVVVGNGSDELLALATRAFVEPLIGLTRYALENATGQTPSLGKGKLRKKREVNELLSHSRYTVQFFQPSYSLYPVLAAIQGARSKPVPLREDFSLPDVAELKKRNWDFEAALTYITTPNAPSGRGFTRAGLEQLCRVQQGVLVLDEAYVDFADENALDLALKYPHVLVARTFSKAYSLCALRIGYCIGHPSLVAALHKVRDSYNVNALAQVAGEAALDSLPHYRRNFGRVIASRQHLSQALARLGFQVFPSQANFIMVRPPGLAAKKWLEQLRAQKILVRWFGSPELRDYLRISIGSESEIELLLRAVRRIRSRAS